MSASQKTHTSQLNESMRASSGIATTSQKRKNLSRQLHRTENRKITNGTENGLACRSNFILVKSVIVLSDLRKFVEGALR